MDVFFFRGLQGRIRLSWITMTGDFDRFMQAAVWLMRLTRWDIGYASLGREGRYSRRMVLSKEVGGWALLAFHTSIRRN